MFDVTAAIYIRVSTEEQTEGWSLEAQRYLCQALAQSRGWSVYKIYEEPGQSAKTDRRPAFQRMMWDAEWQRFDVILVHKLDRFSRSLPDVVSNVARLKRAGVGLVSVSESWIDTTTTMGEIMLYLCALLAQWDNENRARETAKGKAARAHNGLWNGSLSFGYTTLRELKYERLWLEKEHEDGRLDGTAYRRAVERIEAYMARYPGIDERMAIPHPVHAAAVEMLYCLYALGTFSDHEVATLLNEAGYRTRKQRLFTADTVREMLQNRFYLGETQYKGVALPGSHAALVTPELFAKCQEVRAKLERQLENAYQLCKAGDMPYDEYSTLRDSIQRQLQRLRPVCDDELEAAAALLENLPALLKTATHEDLHLIFHATLKAVELDSQAANPVIAVEFHPAIQRLLDLSQAAEQTVPVAEADPLSSMAAAKVAVEATGPASSELAIPPQEPQQQAPIRAGSDKQNTGNRSGSLKQTAGALKERLLGDLRLLLGCPLPDAASGTSPLTIILPNPRAKPLQVPL